MKGFEIISARYNLYIHTHMFEWFKNSYLDNKVQKSCFFSPRLNMGRDGIRFEKNERKRSRGGTYWCNRIIKIRPVGTYFYDSIASLCPPSRLFSFVFFGPYTASSHVMRGEKNNDFWAMLSTNFFFFEQFKKAFLNPKKGEKL